MRAIKIIACVLLPAALGGCWETTLESWTSDRKYTFDPNYSDLQLLGSRIENGRAVPNPNVVVEGTRGAITNYDVNKDSTFQVGGAASAQKVISSISNASIGGSFSDVASTHFSVSGPYHVAATTYVPRQACGDETYDMATDVLNTGQLSITFQDKSGATLDAKAVIPQVQGNASLDIKYDSTTKGLEVGNGMFVGYVAGRVRCSSTSTKYVIQIDNGYVPAAYDTDSLFISARGYKTDADGNAETILVFNNAPVNKTTTTATATAVPSGQKGLDRLPASLLDASLSTQFKTAALTAALQKTPSRSKRMFALSPAFATLTSTVTENNPFANVPMADASKDRFDDNSANVRVVKAGDVLHLGGPQGQPLHIIQILKVDSTTVLAGVSTITYGKLDSDGQ